MLRPEPNRITSIALEGAPLRAILRLSGTIIIPASAPAARSQPEDLIWVREAVEIHDWRMARNTLRFRFLADGPFDWRDVRWPDRIAKPGAGIRAPDHMPRELSRITLAVRHVQTCRLRDVADSAIEAFLGEDMRCISHSHRRKWLGQIFCREAALSDATANPEVAVITVSTLIQPIDALMPGLGQGGVR